MTSRPLIVFDGDDTLWATEALYGEARAACAEIVSTVGLDGAQWERRQRELDLLRVKSLGFSPRRFPGSCRLAAMALAAEAGLLLESSVLRSLEAEASAVFSRKAALTPGVDEVLGGLAREFDLALLTQGDSVVQERRIMHSGLAARFSATHVVPTKSDGVFKRLAGAARANACLSVGNSLASDIHPALRAGFSGIWLTQSGAWTWEEREAGPSVPITLGRLFAADQFVDIPTYVEMWKNAWKVRVA